MNVKVEVTTTSDNDQGIHLPTIKKETEAVTPTSYSPRTVNSLLWNQESVDSPNLICSLVRSNLSARSLAQVIRRIESMKIVDVAILDSFADDANINFSGVDEKVFQSELAETYWDAKGRRTYREVLCRIIGEALLRKRSSEAMASKIAALPKRMSGIYVKIVATLMNNSKLLQAIKNASTSASIRKVAERRIADLKRIASKAFFMHGRVKLAPWIPYGITSFFRSEDMYIRLRFRNSDQVSKFQHTYEKPFQHFCIIGSGGRGGTSYVDFRKKEETDPAKRLPYEADILQALLHDPNGDSLESSIDAYDYHTLKIYIQCFPEKFPLTPESLETKEVTVQAMVLKMLIERGDENEKAYAIASSILANRSRWYRPIDPGQGTYSNQYFSEVYVDVQQNLRIIEALVSLPDEEFQQRLSLELIQYPETCNRKTWEIIWRDRRDEDFQLPTIKKETKPLDHRPYITEAVYELLKTDKNTISLPSPDVICFLFRPNLALDGFYPVIKSICVPKCPPEVIEAFTTSSKAIFEDKNIERYTHLTQWYCGNPLASLITRALIQESSSEIMASRIAALPKPSSSFVEEIVATAFSNEKVLERVKKALPGQAILQVAERRIEDLKNFAIRSKYLYTRVKFDPTLPSDMIKFFHSARKEEKFYFMSDDEAKEFIAKYKKRLASLATFRKFLSNVKMTKKEQNDVSKRLPYEADTLEAIIKSKNSACSKEIPRSNVTDKNSVNEKKSYRRTVIELAGEDKENSAKRQKI